jgi:hypothetical protein
MLDALGFLLLGWCKEDELGHTEGRLQFYGNWKNDKAPRDRQTSLDSFLICQIGE